MFYIRESKVMVHKDPTLISKILEEFHSSRIGGHAGIKRIIARIATVFN